jgi:hypothetical protein
MEAHKLKARTKQLRTLIVLTTLCLLALSVAAPFALAQTTGQQQQNEIASGSFYLIPSYELIIICLIVFLMGFAPLLLVGLRCPEAITFISAQLFGGIVVEKSDDSGVVEFVRAKPYGKEGQYITGADRFGKRTIWVVPRFNGKDFSRRYFLKGIKRPLFDSYGGKCGLANKDLLGAIKIAELDAADRTMLPANIAAWTKENKIETTTVTDADGKRTTKTEVISFFTLTSQKLRQYLHRYYDPSQFDGLLEQKYVQGVSFGRGAKKGGGMGWLLVVIAVVVVVACVIGYLVISGAIK